jgi:hypothetical protein
LWVGWTGHYSYRFLKGCTLFKIGQQKSYP